MFTGNLLSLNDYQLLQQSGLFNLFVLTPLFAFAGYQDKKSHEVSGWVCLSICVGLIAHSVLWGKSGIYIVVGVLCAFLVLGPLDIAQFGQADFLMIAHFITSYTHTQTGMSMMFIAAVLWLICLVVHIVFYRDANGKRWKPFTGMMIPALPSYAASMAIMAVLRVVLLKRIFFAGF